MTRTTRAPPPAIFHGVGEKLKGKLSGLTDGKVTFGGFHGSLPKARPDTMATLLQNSRPPFSALATNVKQHPNGVTSYDITPVGPKFAYKVDAVSHFQVPGPDGKPARFSVVEVKIGPDKETGSKSVYEGRAYQVFGEGPKGPFVAELWDNVTADSAFSDIAANLHNPIVDGGVGDGGFRGLAKDAGALDKKNGGAALEADKPLPQVAVSDSLLAFVNDPKNIPGMTREMRAAFLKTLQAQQPAAGGWTPK
jgi:hypothetical protein